MQNWDSNQVSAWLASIGLSAFEAAFKDNAITGDVLIHADHDMLKELSMLIGPRITLLKALYYLKISQGIPFDETDYVPESEMIEASPSSIQLEQNQVERLEILIHEKDAVIDKLVNDQRNLYTELQKLKDDLKPILMDEKIKPSTPTLSVPTIALSVPVVVNAVKSPLKNTLSKVKMGKSAHTKSSSEEMTPSTPTSNSPMRNADLEHGAIKVYGHRLPNRETESYKTMRVNIGDNCMAIIPEILKKYKLPEEGWENYALFVQFNGTERCLAFDERPLHLVNTMKEGEGIPEFFIKHLKQVNPVNRTTGSSVPVETPVESKGDENVAVAIYEYKATREDELNMAIGDKVRILGRETGWLIVESINSVGGRGWVPAGCLLEGNENTVQTDGSGDVEKFGLVIHDYEKNSPNELTVKQGETVWIHKLFNHWMLVDYKDQSGWVPSCYVSIEKAAESSIPSNEKSLSLDGSSNDKPVDIPVDVLIIKPIEVKPVEVQNPVEVKPIEVIKPMEKAVEVPTLSSTTSQTRLRAGTIDKSQNPVPDLALPTATNLRMDKKLVPPPPPKMEKAPISPMPSSPLIASPAIPQSKPSEEHVHSRKPSEKDSALSKLSNLLDSLNPMMDMQSDSARSSYQEDEEDPVPPLKDPGRQSKPSSAPASRKTSSSQPSQSVSRKSSNAHIPLVDNLVSSLNYWATECKSNGVLTKDLIQRTQSANESMAVISKELESNASTSVLKVMTKVLKEDKKRMAEKFAMMDPNGPFVSKPDRLSFLVKSLNGILEGIQKISIVLSENSIREDVLAAIDWATSPSQGFPELSDP